MAEGDEFVFRAIISSDKFNSIKVGSSDFTDLKTFLRQHAHYYEGARLARTYGIFSAQKIIGYITLVCSEIDLGTSATLHPGAVPENKSRYPYTTYPALKLARLLIDERYRGKKLGKQLVEFSFGMAADEICPRVGCRFLVVDSKKSAVDFYIKCGFVFLDSEENEKSKTPLMFVDLMSVDNLRDRLAPKRAAKGTYQGR